MSKSFRDLVELINKKKQKGETLKPVSKGEQDFAKMHRVEITPHPHADDSTVNARKMKKAKHEAVEYEAIEEDVASSLKAIAKSNKGGNVVFENKDSVPVDPRLAKRMVEAMSKMKKDNAETFRKKINMNVESFLKMVDFVERGAKQ